MKVIAFVTIASFLLSCTPQPMKAFFSIGGDIDKITLDQAEATAEYTVSSNTTWKITKLTDQDWCSITPAQGKGDATVRVSVRADEGPGRSAHFSLTADGVRTKTLQVQQGEIYDDAPAGGFPIIAWTGIEAENAYSKFLVMKEAGINTYLGWYDDVPTVLGVLDDAQRAGVEVIVSSPELETDIAPTVTQLMNHPALFGYHLADEPEVSEIAGLGEWVRQIQAVDNFHPCYINLYPNWAWGQAQYEQNVTRFLDEVPVPFLSFDNYPIVSIDGNPNVLRSDWYRNLEEIAAIARERNMPFWAFALALSHRLDDTHFYRVPTLAELRLQVFSNLAYGAQAIQYFTFHGVYITQRTPVYDLVKTVNQEVQQLADIFLGAHVTDVWHTGRELPEGTRPLGSLPTEIQSLTTSDGGAVVSLLEKADNRYLVVVNKDFREEMQLVAEVGGAVTRLGKDGSPADVAGGALEVAPGDMVIYTWKK